MTNCKRYKVAAIDLGTVSSRLVLAQAEAGAIVESSKHTEITDLGEGVDATGRPLKIDSCYAYGAEHELVRIHWPQFYRPKPSDTG